jgi:hypothetical protein
MRGYALTVVGEVVALAAGLWVLNAVLEVPRAGVGWVSVVVGAHFFALAVVFGLRLFHLLGAIVTSCGVAGLVLVALGASQAQVETVAGVVPGIVLLYSAWRGVRSVLAGGPAAVGPDATEVERSGATARPEG